MNNTKVFVVPMCMALTLSICMISPVGAQTDGQPTPQEGGTGVVYFAHPSRGWAKIPTIVISARDDDARLPLVLRAVDYWNAQFERVGSPFRLGAIAYTSDLVPDDFLVQRSMAVVVPGDPGTAPDDLSDMPGDIIVALSNRDFVSFTSGVSTSAGPKILVAIKDDMSFPLTLPNVALNVITHEMGHAVGLGHNNDATTLMCGRPAPCRPMAFESADDEHIFPITDVESGFLLQLYPPSWTPAP